MNKKSKLMSLGIVLILCSIFCWNMSAESEDGMAYDLIYYNFDENGEDVSEYICAIGEITNLSSKTIKELKIVFTVMGADGIPLGQPYIKNPVPLEGNGKMPVIIDFTDLAELYGCDIGYVDFMYISEIEYDDGSTWSDPNGMRFFLSKAGF